MRASIFVATFAALTGWLVLLQGDGLNAEVPGLKVVDGDTVHRGDEKFRLEGFDAAEIHHAHCDAERRLGELTKSRLEELIASGRVEIVPDEHPAKPDFYHRTLARLLINGVDAGCILMREGYARPWRGHREDWCNEASLSEWPDQPSDCGSTASVN